MDSIQPGKADPNHPDEPVRVDFNWLMPQPPATDAEALKVWQRAQRVPFLNGTVVSDRDTASPVPALADRLPALHKELDEDDYARVQSLAQGKPSKAIALYIPLTRKDLSYQVYSKLRDKIATLHGQEKYYITGLPVAEDTFGVEMFIQMAISAPAAMAVIFLLMLAFFRKLILIVAPLIVALVSVIFTVGSLIVAGYPVHIMSSMIPIFIMPIAVLDSIHIISEFFEKYQATRDRRKTVQAVMDELFLPMLYTSLTSAAGFASLALTPIPPVQVFGLFVAAGIMIAWVLTVTFIPAFVMFIPPRTLENFGAKHAAAGQDTEDATPLGRFLRWVGGATYRWAKPILVAGGLVLAVAAYGITRININDNPIKWFSGSHPIRVADRVLNDHFGGTYMAYLSLSPKQTPWDPQAYLGELAPLARARGRELQASNPAAPAVFERLGKLAAPLARSAESKLAFFQALEARIQRIRYGQESAAPSPAPPAKKPSGGGEGPPMPEGLDAPGSAAPALPSGLGNGPPVLPGGLTEPATTAPATRPAGMSDQEKEAWLSAAQFVSGLKQRQSELFKDPAVLRFMSDLQDALGRTRIVGKSSSLADIVKTVNRDFRSGRAGDYRVPDSSDAVGSLLVQYQSSHRKDDLWHFVTQDFRTGSSLWVQLKSGDNRDMMAVARALDRFVADTAAREKSNPLHPVHHLEHQWFGLTYINVIWQEKMVTGMLEAFTGSFLVVFLLMTILFRSALWGLLSMIPLTVTIAAIYGAVGLVGKDYDMPVAVLSSLTLGLAVDFAIHFLARGRMMYDQYGSYRATAPKVFGEPARAITRNILVIAAGFLPLLLAPLVPYRTVGILLATILLVSGVGTLLLLPALVTVLEKKLFPKDKKPMGATCNCVTCAVSAITMVALVAMTLNQSLAVGWKTLTWVSLAVVPAMAVTCGLMSRRSKCRRPTPPIEETHDE